MRMNSYTLLRHGFIALGAALLPGISAACASCGCTLSPDWEILGISNNPGFRMDLRYDYLNQNQLRSGTASISPTLASRYTPDGKNQEVEKFTNNRYLTLGLDYSLNQDWGINLQLPYIRRDHSTLGTASDGITAGDGGGQYDSSTSAMGDVKLVVRYQGLNKLHNIGLMLGLKLPTGSYTQTGTSSDAGAPGSVAIDRGLQPGTGTSDLILGAYASRQLQGDWDSFIQGIYQRALNSRDNYRPGNGINLNLGIRYTGFEKWTPSLQLNARKVAHDSGSNADTSSTGGTLIYLSPGVSVPASEQLALYGFVQLPLYQDVRGVQLTPRYTVSVGARWTF